VRHRDHGDVHSREPSDLAREDSAGVDHDLCLDLAPIGDDPSDPVAVYIDRRHARVRVDLGAAAARSFR